MYACPIFPLAHLFWQMMPSQTFILDSCGGVQNVFLLFFLFLWPQLESLFFPNYGFPYGLRWWMCNAGEGTLPAHMMSTTTMMMSSPALSWAAWPTSSIVTSSGEGGDTDTLSRQQISKHRGRSPSHREDVRLPSVKAFAGKDKERIKRAGRRVERPGVNSEVGLV